MRLRTSAGRGKRGIDVAGNGIHRTDVEGYVEGFALRFVVSFFSAPAEVGRVVPLRVTLEARVCLFPDCTWHWCYTRSGGMLRCRE